MQILWIFLEDKFVNVLGYVERAAEQINYFVRKNVANLKAITMTLALQ